MPVTSRELVKELGITAHLLQRTLSEKFDYGDERISETNIRIIIFLWENRDRDIYNRDIEKEFSVRRSTVSKVMSLMEEKGMIQRISTDDARMKKIVLTPQVKDAILKTVPIRQRIENELTDGIDEKEREVFCTVLRKMRDNLTKIHIN